MKSGMNVVLNLLILCFASTALATADVAPTSTPTTEATKASLPAEVRQLKAKTGLDAEIDDAKLRAESGAKSKYSTSLNMIYSGASLNDPFGETRPNVEGSAHPPNVKISGMVGLRYRFDKNTSFFGATGISRSRPFQNKEGDEWEADNIMMHLNSTFRMDEMQISSTWLAYVWTTDYLKSINNLGMLGYSVSALSPIGGTRFRGGITGSISASFFDGNTNAKGRDVKAEQADLSLAISPSLKYQFSDRFNGFTSLQLVNLVHTRDRESFSMGHSPVSQNLGFGYAITRDFFVSPNIDFRPSDMAAKRTTANLSAVINL